MEQPVPSEGNGDVVLCTIIKGEHLYLQEWLDYNIKLGFDHIYLYDNDDSNPHDVSSLEKYQGKVSIIPMYGKGLQMYCYTQFLHNYKQKHEWVAFLDADEFIVLRKHKSIKELVRECGQDSALVLNWVLFGSSGLEKYENKPVLERFLLRQKDVNLHVKTITRLEDMAFMLSPHHGQLIRGNARDCKGRIVDGPYHETGDEDIACVHHYFTKSKEEFHIKCARGKADDLDFRIFNRDFPIHDTNEIEDRSALEFFRATP